MPRVFLVEDESTIRSTLRDTVPWAQLGYEFVGEATDGEMALPLISTTRPDVLITDIKMPFMDGLSLSKLVLKDLPNTKIIIISGYDDFEYARQAIEIGVEQYLLKPITKANLMNVLREVKDKIEQEQEQRNYQAQFQRDSQEYEQFARRSFMEQVVAGKLSVQQIYEDADRLGLELRAQSYCIALFSAMGETYSETDARVREDLLGHFMKHPEYLLLRWNLTTYMLLIMGEKSRMDNYIQSCIAAITNRYTVYDGTKPWYVAIGMTGGRLSQLPECFEDVSRLWAYRYIQPDTHILTSETVKEPGTKGASTDLESFDVNKFNPEMLTEIMKSAAPEEIPNVVSEFLLDISSNTGSQAFCHYVMLSTRFTAIQFVTTLGIKQEKLLEEITCQDMTEQQNITLQDLRRYMNEFLMQAVKLRNQSSANQYRDILSRAVDYIDSHYTDETLSLNSVAKEVNISANYLSAVFSQEMKSTFVEYVTSKRMAKAKDLLRNTDKHSGEIALEVGYKDSHYFSFLFKKTQGMTTREYRAGGKH